MDYPRRKNLRLPSYDYTLPGYYFITLCTLEKQPFLGRVDGSDLIHGAAVLLSPYGEIMENRLQLMANFYPNLTLEKYVIMPNHIHLLIRIHEQPFAAASMTNTPISQFIGTFKRLTNREAGRSLWQARSYDHVIRNEADYLRIWEYIDTNPARWAEDRFFSEN